MKKNERRKEEDFVHRWRGWRRKLPFSKM